MKKIQYTTPALHIVRLQQSDAILLTASDNDGNILGDGGNTSEGGITSGDVKASNYNVWDEDWSR